MSARAALTGCPGDGAMHTEKNTPIRMCVICRRRFPKGELSRHVAGETGLDALGRLVRDPRQTMLGRGYYVCSDEACTRRLNGYKGHLKRKGVAHGR